MKKFIVMIPAAMAACLLVASPASAKIVKKTHGHRMMMHRPGTSVAAPNGMSASKGTRSGGPVSGKTTD